MIISVNVDPSFSGGYADPQELKNMGFTGVSLVSRPESHQYAYDAQGAGLHVLGRIARESNGHMVPADTYQIGNEPDLTSPSSWTMSPTEWITMWRQYRNTYPNLEMIGPGLASGDPYWWKQVSSKISNCAGVGIHPYAKKASEAAPLLQAYANVTPKRKLWVSEWNRPANEIKVFLGMLGSLCAYISWFCWSDSMVDGMGLINKNEDPKYEALEHQDAISAWTV